MQQPKGITGSSVANYSQAWEADNVIGRGPIHPTLSRTSPLFDAPKATFDAHRHLHQGKVGVVCLAPEEGLGVREPGLRERHLEAVMRFRDV
jgi:crotonyl-CoA reductase